MTNSNRHHGMQATVEGSLLEILQSHGVSVVVGGSL